jgi:drug/metabolite transporter (DMT)-like permease
LTVLFINLIPVFGVILATAFLGENIHGFHVAGAVCIIVGIRLVVSNIPTGLRR